MDKEQIKKLIAERDRLDSQLAELHDVLKSVRLSIEHFWIAPVHFIARSDYGDTARRRRRLSAR